MRNPLTTLLKLRCRFTPYHRGQVGTKPSMFHLSIDLEYSMVTVHLFRHELTVYLDGGA